MPQPEITAALTKLRTQVERIPGIRQSIKDYVTGLLKQVEDLKDDPAELQLLVDSVEAGLGDIANSIVANAPTPVPPNG